MEGLRVRLESPRAPFPRCCFESSPSSMAGMGPWDREAVAGRSWARAFCVDLEQHGRAG